MMSARVATALALVSFNLCLAQQSPEAKSGLSSEAIPEIEEESLQEEAQQQDSPSQTAQLAAGAQCSEHANLENCRYGIVTSKRVRMRTAAQLDAPVIRELDKGTPLKITAEAGDFYMVIPPFPMKAYVFRTYVLDGKIEGDRVNVRLGPSPESAILTQLSQGYVVAGKPSTTNAKWLEIDLPLTTRFFISKDYVQIVSETQFQEIARNFKQAKETPKVIPKEEVLASKENHEEKAPSSPEPVKNDKRERSSAKSEPSLNAWQAKEENLKSQWLLLNAPSTDKDYQDYVSTVSKKLKGTLEPYSISGNAPGNYLLKDGSKVIAIVYSANLDLAAYLGQLIEVKAVERDNFGYAYPAFCILEVE
jgi:hypothetical protein